jgi:hypothetical protein
MGPVHLQLGLAPHLNAVHHGEMALTVLPTGYHCVITRSLLHIEEATDTKTSPQIYCSAMFHVSRQLVQTNVAILKVIHVS